MELSETRIVQELLVRADLPSFHVLLLRYFFELDMPPPPADPSSIRRIKGPTYAGFNRRHGLRLGNEVITRGLELAKNNFRQWLIGKHITRVSDLL